MDLVVVRGARAGQFYVKYRDELFPEVPMLLTGNERGSPFALLRPGDSFVSVSAPAAEMVNSVLKLLLGTSTIAVVLGKSPQGQFWVNQRRRQGTRGDRKAVAARRDRCRHHMPDLNGIDALVQLKHDNPDVRVVFLTMHKNPAYARRALEAGACGYVLKHSAQAELLLAVRAALDGNVFISPTLVGDVFREMKSRVA